MPYRIRNKDGEFHLVQQSTGKVLGTHSTKKAAIAQLRAIEREKR